jgi:hypothetical protein
LVSNRESGGLLTVVEILELRRGYVVQLGVKALVVPPADPGRSHDLEVRPTAPRSLPPDARPDFGATFVRGTPRKPLMTWASCG